MKLSNRFTEVEIITDKSNEKEVSFKYDGRQDIFQLGYSSFGWAILIPLGSIVLDSVKKDVENFTDNFYAGDYLELFKALKNMPPKTGRVVIDEVESWRYEPVYYVTNLHYVTTLDVTNRVIGRFSVRKDYLRAFCVGQGLEKGGFILNNANFLFYDEQSAKEFADKLNNVITEG